jgi:hypothetical protein
MAVYLVDTNVFIQAKNLYYPYRQFPGVWEWLDREFQSDNFASIIPVHDEMQKIDDELKVWVNDPVRRTYFLPVTDIDCQNNYRQVMSWVSSGKYTEHQVEAFADGADPHIIAKAKTLEIIVMTHEIKDKSGKVPIPNVCDGLGVKHCDLFSVLKRSPVQFHI